jgi:hypothetical protein
MNTSKKIKDWRKRTKERIVEAFGSICCVCKDKYFPEVFDLHHVEGIKEFPLGAIRASSISWAKIVVELRKCVMVCANCHRAIHSGHKEVPSNALRFNEKYVDYRKDLKKKPLKICEICGNLCFNRFCSEKCSNMGSRKVKERPPITEINELVSVYGYCAVGRMFGVSDNAIRKWLK